MGIFPEKWERYIKSRWQLLDRRTMSTTQAQDDKGVADQTADFEKHIENAITEIESAKQELEGNTGRVNRLRDDLDDMTEELFNEVLQVARGE